MTQVKVVLDEKEYLTMVDGSWYDVKKKVRDRMGTSGLWLSIGGIIVKKELINCIQFVEMIGKEIDK